MGDGWEMNNEIMVTFDILESIECERSLNGKQDILVANSNNEVLKQLLRLAYDPFQQFYIKKLPKFVATHNQVTYETNYGKFIQLLVNLSHRFITGNAAIAAVEDFFNGCDKREYCWYSRVLTKDMRIGLADKGINKAFPKLIPTYEVQLANKINPEDLNLDTVKAIKLLPQFMVIQYKIDGYRVNIHRPDDKTVILLTRNGKTISGYKELEKSALSLPPGYVYDGEVVSPELFEWIQHNAQNGLTSANRDLFSAVMSHAFSKEDDKKGIFNIFDMVSLDDWRVRVSTLPYSERLKLMNELVAPLNLPNIMVVPTSRVYSKSNPADLREIVDTFHNFVSIGWEGLMIKDVEATYEWKRTKALLKMKMMDTIDLVVTGIYQGTGKYQYSLGGVWCDYKGNKLGVGSGFTDEQRHLFWTQPNYLIGKTIEVAYQSISHNKEGKESVSFPVFKGIRDDK